MPDGFAPAYRAHAPAHPFAEDACLFVIYTVCLRKMLTASVSTQQSSFTPPPRHCAVSLTRTRPSPANTNRVGASEGDVAVDTARRLILEYARSHCIGDHTQARWRYEHARHACALTPHCGHDGPPLRPQPLSRKAATPHPPVISSRGGGVSRIPMSSRPFCIHRPLSSAKTTGEPTGAKPLLDSDLRC